MITLIKTLNRSSDRKKSRNLDKSYNMFEFENKKELVRGIRTDDLTYINLKSYPLHHKKFIWEMHGLFVTLS